MNFFTELLCLEVTYEKSAAMPGIIDVRIKTKDSVVAAKIYKNWPGKVFDEWVKSCVLFQYISFFVWCQTFPWSGKQHLQLLKNAVAHWVWNECQFILIRSKWINHVLPQNHSVVDLNSEVCEKKSITFSVSEPIRLAARYFHHSLTL